jgi:thiamine biosynthesis lipoprotein
VKRLICIILALALLCLCTGCEKVSQETLFAMNTVMDLKIWGTDREKGLQTVTQLLQDLENTWSNQKPDSQISKLNSGSAQLTETQQQLLDRVTALSQRTGGAFDPQLYGVTRLWNFTEEEHTVPSEEQIQKGKEEKLWDLGGAVKGFAGGLAVETLQMLGVTHAILNLGGNVQTYGSKPDGTPWSIGIQNPDGGDPIGAVSVVGTTAVVTSGDYQRYFVKDGVRYHHILDPETGMPADSGLRGVTVICRDGLTADCLSTALFVMGLEEGTQLWRQSDDFEAVFITADGSVYATEGAALSGCEYEVIVREN